MIYDENTKKSAEKVTLSDISKSKSVPADKSKGKSKSKSKTESKSVPADKSKSKNYHAGHRSRTLETFLSRECYEIPDHILLEMILYFSIPRQDTNRLAHELIEHCGSFNNVFDASEKQLTEVMGIGKKTAQHIKLIGIASRAYDVNAASPSGKRFANLDEIGEYICAILKNRKQEVFYILMLDSQNTLLGCRLIENGSPNQADISIDRILQLSYFTGCSKIVVAHNHPGGTPEPSDEDVTFTLSIKRAFDPLSTEFVEHFIIAGNNYIPIYRYLADIRRKKFENL